MADETTPETPVAEDAVRRYLLFLEDPAKLRDPAEIQRKTAAVVNATDPIDKLKALAELERASMLDESGLRAAFVEHAKPWAEEHGVSAGAFAELRVSADVLSEAGFDVSGLRRSRSRGRSSQDRSTGGDRSGGRRRQASAADIRSAMLESDGPFTLTEIIDRVGGGSPGLLRKVAEELLAAGQIQKLGPAPHHGKQGRAPIQYARA